MQENDEEERSEFYGEELRLEDFEDWKDPAVQLNFLECWDETLKRKQ